MNEKFKQMIIESGAHTIHGDGGFVEPVYKFQKDQIEKFAELIVKECVKILNKRTTMDSGVVYAPEVEHDILEHFGIER